MSDTVVSLQELVHTVEVEGAAAVAVVAAETVQVVTVGEQGPAGPSGTQDNYVAAEALSGHIAVTLNTAGLAIAADCRTQVHAASVLGVTTGAATAGNPATVRGVGFIESPGWGLTPGLPVYLGEAGALVQVVPPSALFIKPLGYAVSSTAVLIDLQPAIFLT